MMAWFNLFSGPSAEKLEQNGDTLVAAGLWGEAKLAYERAHRKLEAATDPDKEHLARLSGKIVYSRDNLALKHHQHAVQLTAGGQYEDALELITLASELTDDASLKQILSRQYEAIAAARVAETPQMPPDPVYQWNPKEAEPDAQAPDDQFMALCGTLPDPVMRAYLSYGADFKSGYIALNNGDFETAARHLVRALKSHHGADSYIPLELATAYMHLGRLDQAIELLETLLRHHPDALPAYQILCEIHWEQGAFDRAEGLLDSVPSELTTSRAIFTLRGETLFQAGRFDDAKTFYGDFLSTYGWDESIARALARTFEALNELNHAQKMYEEIMGRCNSCHSRIDPLVKEKVADLQFAAGKHDTAVLELYLALAHEQPHKACGYYAKVSRIYQSLGNDTEARRFLMLADRIDPS